MAQLLVTSSALAGCDLVQFFVPESGGKLLL